MEYLERTNETCATCKHFSAEDPTHPLTPTTTFCVLKKKFPVKTLRTSWCDQYTPSPSTSSSSPASASSPALASSPSSPSSSTPSSSIIDRRISRQVMFMEIAKTVAKRATCFRLNVGCVLTYNNTIVSIGYNGVPSGEPHCTGNQCPGRDQCLLTTHAEANAIARLNGSPFDTVYVTDSPCGSCAATLFRAGARTVYFAIPYRITDSLEYLRDNGVGVYQVTPSGQVIEWFSKEIQP